MTASVDLMATIRRLTPGRKHRFTRWLVRLLMGPDYTVIHRGDLSTLNDYVTLWNDVRPVVTAARHLFSTTEVDGRRYIREGICTWNGDALLDALRRYERLYPEHRA